VVLLIAASGGTPYVLGALRAAREAGALTIGFANNPDAPVAGEAEIGITLDTGPEVISGSTRLKAGTSQKIALNTFSSALMVRLNKVYGNLMVDLKATNAKLVLRAIRLTMFATGADEARPAPCWNSAISTSRSPSWPCPKNQCRAGAGPAGGCARQRAPGLAALIPPGRSAVLAPACPTTKDVMQTSQAKVRGCGCRRCILPRPFPTSS
jgi:hypothetical protein